MYPFDPEVHWQGKTRDTTKYQPPTPKYSLIPKTATPASNTSEAARLTSVRAVHPLKFNMQDRGGPLALRHRWLGFLLL